MNPTIFAIQDLKSKSKVITLLVALADLIMQFLFKRIFRWLSVLFIFYFFSKKETSITFILLSRGHSHAKHDVNMI